MYFFGVVGRTTLSCLYKPSGVCWRVSSLFVVSFPRHTLVQEWYSCVLLDWMVSCLADSASSGMLMLQSFVEGVVLDISVAGATYEGSEISPLVNLYTHNIGCEVSAYVSDYLAWILSVPLSVWEIAKYLCGSLEPKSCVFIKIRPVTYVP